MACLLSNTGLQNNACFSLLYKLNSVKKIYYRGYDYNANCHEYTAINSVTSILNHAFFYFQKCTKMYYIKIHTGKTKKSGLFFERLVPTGFQSSVEEICSDLAEIFCKSLIYDHRKSPDGCKSL